MISDLRSVLGTPDGGSEVAVDAVVDRGAAVILAFEVVLAAGEAVVAGPWLPLPPQATSKRAAPRKPPTVEAIVRT
jgi:hypothetical protein